MVDKSLNDVMDDAIAIIGMAGKFPGANTIQQLWENVCAGKESISFFSDEELIESGISQHDLKNPNYVKAKGVINDIDQFDASFFGITPRDATILDPQQRVFLECVWTALENAGYSSEETAGRVGVFAGCGFNTYYAKIALQNKTFLDEVGDFNIALGNAADFLSSRISYKFNFTGPSITLQTACSTSLVAVCQACNSLLEYQCDMAIAGGVSAFFPIKSGYYYQPELIFSADGHCRAFDASSTGTLFGMGVGAVILKRLTDAIRDQDFIYAVIRGYAVNNDGSHKVGYTAPAQVGQTNVIIEAQTVAQIDPSTIQYIEAHATGTQIGDPIEVAALAEAFVRQTDKKHFCALGTLKSNIGHLDAAAGIAGLIKTVLVLQHKKIPPAANFKKPNPKIDFEQSPFYVPTQLTEWETEDKPRRAGVSSFGVGGTNAHVILEEAPVLPITASTIKPYYLFTLSAKTEIALKQKMRELEKWLQENKNIPIENISYTLNTGRQAFEKRCIFVASSNQELHNLLQQVINNQSPENFLINLDKPHYEPVFDEVLLKIIGDIETLTLDAKQYQKKLLALGDLYVKGYNIDWEKLHHHETKKKIPLPTYPFARDRYWIPESNAPVSYPLYYYHPVWITTPSSTDETMLKIEKIKKGHILLFSDSTSVVTNALKQQFPNQMIHARWGNDFSEFNSSEYLLNPHEMEHYKKLMAVLMEKKQLPDYIIFLASNKPDTIESFYCVFYCLHALLKIKPQQRIDYIYSYAFNENQGQPYANALSGLMKSVAQEYPAVQGRLFSVDAVDAQQIEHHVQILLESMIGLECEVRYVHNKRQVKRLQEIIPARKKSLPFRKQGVYFITGGLGHIGWLIADYLARTYQARLILLGRSELTTELTEKLNQLITDGADVLYQQGNVANRDELARALAAGRSQFGTIQGVIHCAGIIHDAPFLQKTPPQLAKVMAPKIDGTRYLQELTQDDSLDCFILFSSTAALFGNIGQTDYAYANHFLDAMTEKNKMISINWAPWLSGGMKINPALYTWMEKTLGVFPLSSEQGLHAFCEAIAGPYSQVVVLSGQQDKINSQLITHFNLLHETPITDVSDEAMLIDIERQLLEKLVELTQLPIQKIDKNTSLFEMGIDSILLSQLLSKVERDFNIKLNEAVREILATPTITNIAKQIILVMSPSSEVSVDKKKPFDDQIIVLRE